MTSNEVDACSRLFSENYGIWSQAADEKLRGKRVKLSPDRLREMFVSRPNRHVTMMFDGDSLVGHVFYIRADSPWSHSRKITFVQQLVLDKKYRGRRFGLKMLQSVFGLSSDDAWGLYTSNPLTIRALEDATFRRISINGIQRKLPGLKTVLSDAFEDVRWLDSFRNGCVDTGFKVDHGDIGRKVAKAYPDGSFPFSEPVEPGPLLKRLFSPVITQPSAASALQNHAFERYLTGIVGFIGRSLTEKGGMLLELDFAKRCHTQLNILQETDLEVQPATHLRILQRVLEGISVPFRGEPLKGLQVMGPLETRALDFRNLVILSANEGSFPRRSVQPSFIPPELRKGFGLPTYEFQDAVWAYYFYRMIQRPQKVWLLYDSRTEGLKNGEESRYIKQLQYHFHWDLKRLTAAAAIHPVQPSGDIPKTEEQVARIRESELSASSLQSYLACPAKFYFQMVEGLRAEDEVAESLDAGMLGNVFHHTMQRLYGGKSIVTGADLAVLHKDKARLKGIIREEVLAEMHSIEVSGRNLVLEEVILDYVLRTLSHDAALLKKAGSEGFRIIGLEKREKADFEGFHFKGFIDRLDSYRPGEIRIVDYKTGKVEDAEVNLDDANAAAVVEKLFGPVNKNRPKIALQLFLYDFFASKYGLKVVNAIYSTSRLYTGDMPEVPESEEFTRLVKERLKTLLAEIADVSVPFRRTDEAETCTWCDFKNICGR